jgi:hypothetical protein
MEKTGSGSHQHQAGDSQGVIEHFAGCGIHVVSEKRYLCETVRSICCRSISKCSETVMLRRQSLTGNAVADLLRLQLLSNAPVRVAIQSTGFDKIAPAAQRRRIGSNEQPETMARLSASQTRHATAAVNAWPHLSF